MTEAPPLQIGSTDATRKSAGPHVFLLQLDARTEIDWPINCQLKALQKNSQCSDAEARA